MILVKPETMIAVTFMECVLRIPYILLIFLTLLIDICYYYCYMIGEILLKFMKIV
jgi:hypothetical protein